MDKSIYEFNDKLETKNQFIAYFDILGYEGTVKNDEKSKQLLTAIKHVCSF